MFLDYMTKVIVVIFMATIAMVASAQSITIDQLDKKTAKTYNKALKCLNKGERQEGIAKLEEVTTKYPAFTKAANKLVGIYLDDGQNEKAIELMKVMLPLSEVPDYRVAGSLSYAYEDEGNYSQAIEVMEQLISKGQLSGKKLESATVRKRELAFRQEGYRNPSEFKPVKLSTAVNSSDAEYHPGFNADGSVMMFVKVGRGANRNEDLYSAKQVSLDSFTVARPLSELNSSAQEGAFTLSQDGNVLIFTACGHRESIGGCDLFISFRKANKWSPARNMGPDINSRFFDSSPTISSDNRTLYFSSKRPGGQGGSDIWMAQLNSENRWDPAVNLGPKINTSGNDEAPYIHPDGKSLYFTSDGHIGFGSYDIFLAKYSKGEWEAPTNLGYPINTKEREGGLFVDLTGNRAYYSSQLDLSGNKDNNNLGDIYYFELPEAYKPDLVSYIKVEVRDSESGGLINATAEIKGLIGNDLSPDKTIEIGGVLLTTIIPGEYSLSISKKGYLFHSENIVLEKSLDLSNPFIYKVELQKIKPEVIPEKPKPIVLKNIFFASGSAELLPTSDFEIAKLVDLLSINGELRIKILGHTDNVGSDAANLKLSADRAKAVYDKIVRSGIASERLQYEGKGESMPIADNETVEGRQTNRRTEFILIK